MNPNETPGEKAEPPAEPHNCIADMNMPVRLEAAIKPKSLYATAYTRHRAPYYYHCPYFAFSRLMQSGNIHVWLRE